MNAADFDAPTAIGWRTTAKVAVVWLLGCPLAGIAVAEFSGEFGSFMFVVIGAYLGVLGALVHGTLSRRHWFLHRPYIVQTLLAATASASPLLLFWAIQFSSKAGSLGFFLQDLALPVCAFSAGAAWGGSVVIHRQSI